MRGDARLHQTRDQIATRFGTAQMQKGCLPGVMQQKLKQGLGIGIGALGDKTVGGSNACRAVAHAKGMARQRDLQVCRSQHCGFRGKDHRSHRRIGQQGPQVDGRQQGREDGHGPLAVTVCNRLGKAGRLRFRPRDQHRKGAGLRDHVWGVTCELSLAQRRTMQAELTFLGIESSCDDSAAAVVRAGVGEGGQILSSVVEGQVALHAAFGGVVPEIAARAHAERLDGCVERALAMAGLGLGDLDGIAVTAGPGLIGGVLSGVMLAKGLAAGTGLPMVGVNHLAGHALTPRLTDGLDFPYLMLLVSGGHCQFLIVDGPEMFRRIGGTIDDAPGEAFDKTAKLLGLPQPGGPAVEAEAALGDAGRFVFPRPLLDRPGCDMSFSGLKTALLRARDALITAQGGLFIADRRDLCAGFQTAVAAVLVEKTRRALIEYLASAPKTPSFAIAGGVAANKPIRASLETLCAAQGVRFLAPPLRLCTDNAAMIAFAGIERFRLGHQDSASLSARPRWPLDQAAPAMIGSGKKGAKA